MRAYKFLNADDVPKMMAGSILMRPLRYFRDIEAKMGTWIGDGLENSVEITLSRTHGLTYDEAKSVMPPGYSFDDTGFPLNITEGVRFIYESGDEKFVFCISVGDFGHLREAMCVRSERNPQPYDACVEIMYVKSFFQHIVNTGMIGQARFLDVFEPPGLGKVRYEDVSRSVASLPLAEPDPFRKRRQFQFQSESRLVATPRTVLTDAVKVTFKDAGLFIREKEVPFPKS